MKKIATFLTDIVMTLCIGILILNSDLPWWAFLVVMVFGVFQRLTGFFEGWAAAWIKFDPSRRTIK